MVQKILWSSSCDLLPFVSTFWPSEGLTRRPRYDGIFQKPGDHPNVRSNALGVKRPFSDGQRTEQVKTGQVNPDRPLVGPSVDTFVGCFVGSPRRAENREISPRGCSRGATRGATLAFACSVCGQSELWESSGVFSEQLSEFEIPFSE